MNNICSLEDQLSDADDKVFFGPLTLKEIKKRFIPEHRQTIGYCVSTDSENSSLKLIETHSAPDVSLKGDFDSLNITKTESSPDLIPDLVISDWDDDSFMRLEQMVSDMCMSTDKPHDESKSETFTTPSSINNNEIKLTNDNNIENQVLEVTPTKYAQNMAFKTPLKNNNLKQTLNTPQRDVFKTPSSNLKMSTPFTRNPTSYKKQLPTPKRYQNVASPIATYIRNSPQVSLMKLVCPKKPLPGVSSIPKPLRQIPRPKDNKENVKVGKLDKQENIKLPAVAYRNAKETKVIHIPDIENMPKNNWAKKVASSIPRAMVVKHNHRETGSAKKPLQGRQEDSFDDLPLLQADLSVCTQKSSFTKPRKNI